MENIKKVTVNMTEDDVALLKELAKEKQVTFTTMLRQAIAEQRFLNDVKKRKGKILVQESDDSIKEIVFN